ncbi:MAG: hypothetical protein HUK22_00825, partial [Thermoguttaceae bacterium]|nr:hypothetical protein [Thermoguttaceae bacterium]
MDSIPAALAALLLNLCAAGGIGYPAISFPLALAAAAIVNRRDAALNDVAPETARTSKAAVSPAWIIGVVAVFAIFYATAFKPRQADFFFGLRTENSLNAAFYRDSFAAAAPESVDARSSEVVVKYYLVVAERYANSPGAETEAAWKRLRATVLASAPHSPIVCENCGDADFALYESHSERRVFLESAIDFYRAAVEKSPTETGKYVKLIRALRVVGEEEERRRLAEKALELDAITPHLDRKLPDEARDELMLIAGRR